MHILLKKFKAVMTLNHFEEENLQATWKVLGKQLYLTYVVIYDIRE